MIDLQRTLALIKGAIFDPQATWDRYLPEAGQWQKTALLLTGPLVVGSAVVSYILALIFASRLPFYPSPSFFGMLSGIIVAAIAVAVFAFVVATLAGLFKGKNSFPLALAATSLAFVPSYIGSAFTHIPLLGGLMALGLGIYGLVLLWKILPKYLDVPSASRAGHYIASLVISVIVFFILAAVTDVGLMSAGTANNERSNDSGILSQRDSGTVTGGLFGEMERRGRIMEQAESDTYVPPGNGKISTAQVQQFIVVMTKIKDYRIAQMKELEALGKKVENDELETLSEAFSGMTGIMNLTTAEIEVVKTGGANWAEH